MIFRRHSDLPLKGDATSRFLPWIIGVMVFLATLSVAGLLLAQDVTQRWRSALAGTLTVQVPPPFGETDPQAQLADVLQILRGTPGIARAEPVSIEQSRALLEPWLGSGQIIDELPLPRLIDVALMPGARLDFAALETRLAGIAPGIVLDDHGRWLGDLVRVARSVELVAATAVLLVALTAVLAVVFAVRTGLAIHREVIDVLHLVGARDSYIAQQFARHALTLSLRGSIPGALFALVLLLGVTMLANGGAEGLAAEGFLSADLWRILQPLDWAALAAVPVGAVLLAVLATRLAVMRALSRLV